MLFRSIIFKLSVILNESQNITIKEYLDKNKNWNLFVDKHLNRRIERENRKIGSITNEEIEEEKRKNEIDLENIQSGNIEIIQNATEVIPREEEKYKPLKLPDMTKTVILMPINLDEDLNQENEEKISKYNRTAMYESSLGEHKGENPGSTPGNELKILPRFPESPLSLLEPIDSFKSMSSTTKKGTGFIMVIDSAQDSSNSPLHKIKQKPHETKRYCQTVKFRKKPLI